MKRLIGFALSLLFTTCPVVISAQGPTVPTRSEWVLSWPDAGSPNPTVRSLYVTYRLRLAAGSATTPSLWFGTTGTGMYSAGAAELDWTISGTKRLALTATALTVTGDVLTADANGPGLENAASSATNPTVFPDQANRTSGIGGTSGDVEIITGGNSRMNFDVAGVITTDERFQISGGDISIADSSAFATNVAMFGSSSDFRIGFCANQTPDMSCIGVDSASRGVILGEVADIAATDLAHPNPTQPTFWIHTNDVSPTTRYGAYSAAGQVHSLYTGLTESAASNVVQITVAAGAVIGGVFHYSVYAADATNHQIRKGRIIFSAVNEAGTETCVLGTVEEIDNTPTGTLTATVTCDTSPSNAINLQLNAVSSLTQTSLRAFFHVELDGAAPSEILPQ